MINFARLSILVVPLAVLAACNSQLEPIVEPTPGLAENLEEVQMTFPKITRETFRQYDRDGDGMLSPLEQEMLTMDANSSGGIAGQVGALDGEGL
ncbi:EF-hand domain-containing protein [Loktanella sp. SALINAS62]|uniref:EF-hand domain-containing protein n=1 Tax=Loktanella sp. SALINAS62 TaxID=2706124 RepID=UPI001B8B740D|nr:EF-hand domain-containing protein [Loktanella sp. SALINAS62]MBS1302058.1 hypothetical protein [Loktanella sp. SALINAS62]